MQTHPKNFKQAFKIVGLLMVTTLCFLWAWNTAMPLVFNLAEIQLKEALALLILLAIPSFLLGRHRRAHDHSDEFQSPS